MQMGPHSRFLPPRSFRASIRLNVDHRLCYCWVRGTATTLVSARSSSSKAKRNFQTLNSPKIDSSDAFFSTIRQRSTKTYLSKQRPYTFRQFMLDVNSIDSSEKELLELSRLRVYEAQSQYDDSSPTNKVISTHRISIAEAWLSRLEQTRKFWCNHQFLHYLIRYTNSTPHYFGRHRHTILYSGLIAGFRAELFQLKKLGWMQATRLTNLTGYREFLETYRSDTHWVAPLASTIDVNNALHSFFATVVYIKRPIDPKFASFTRSNIVFLEFIRQSKVDLQAVFLRRMKADTTQTISTALSRGFVELSKSTATIHTLITKWSTRNRKKSRRFNHKIIDQIFVTSLAFYENSQKIQAEVGRDWSLRLSLYLSSLSPMELRAKQFIAPEYWYRRQLIRAATEQKLESIQAERERIRARKKEYYKQQNRIREDMNRAKYRTRLPEDTQITIFSL